MKVTVAMPAPMKLRTATKDRTDKRPNPQTPWPLVQPLPQTVPTPTSRPAGMSKAMERVGKVGISKDWPSKLPPTIKPAKKAHRQLSGLSGAESVSAVMLLTPAILPKPHQRSQLAMPVWELLRILYRLD